MSNSFGENYRFTIFGQSHAEAIGVTIEGLPAGTAVDIPYVEAFLARRAPGQGRFSTARREEDKPVFLCGLAPNGLSCGSPITAVIYNSDARSKDYSQLEHKPRPGHADYPAMIKYGRGRDYAGGGQFSGRLTAPLCIAGAIAARELEKVGITVSAHVISIGGKTTGEEMEAAMAAAQAEGDSVGGVIECAAQGVPAGLGEPMFSGLENHIARAVFAIPAVKGIEFGAGFSAADMRGSENNDEFYFDGAAVKTRSNNSGGILGGISTGMPIVFRAAVKPTPSIKKCQNTVDMADGTDAELSVGGRHDPCIVPRALPCMEAAMAVALYDMLLEKRKGDI